MSTAARLIRDARHRAGMTQSDLADAIGVAQSVVSRMERDGSNPTAGTLEAALAAAGRGLSTIPRGRGSIDETLVAGQLRLTPAQRWSTSEATYDDVTPRSRTAPPG